MYSQGKGRKINAPNYMKHLCVYTVVKLKFPYERGNIFKFCENNKL